MTDDQLIESLRARVAELEALPGNVLAREHEPFCWTTYPPSGRYSQCTAEVALWERNSWTIVPLYARPVPARRMTDDEINDLGFQCGLQPEDAVNPSVEEFARAIEAALFGGELQAAEARHEND